MDLGLTGKVAIVAASSRGLGKAAAMGLAAEGARVVMCSRNEVAVTKAADEVRDTTKAEVLALSADVTKVEDVRRLVRAAADQFGALNILLNNAGGPPVGRFEEITDEQWQASYDLNLLSTIRLTREVIPHMRKAGGGRIINVVSIAVKEPIENLILSNAIRAGVVGMAKTLASELGKDQITVNNICPGRIFTERIRNLIVERARRQGIPYEEAKAAGQADIPLDRYGDPQDFANVVTFLASDRASYITGTTLLVDGGLYRGLM
ncbi:MAG: SDR family oxidoreductase [Deltaproteobacteria bacterium]|nr:SDR family oxidoreductase [Deltaproteobacteria bacterium]